MSITFLNFTCETKSQNMKVILGLAAMLAVSAACSGIKEPHRAIDLSHMDTTVRAQDDFYQYVNGNWMKTTEIPADKARWGSFDELRESTDDAVLSILKKSLRETFERGTDGQKIADLYRSYLNVEHRNELGTDPIKPYLQKIDSIETLNDLYDYLIEVGPIGGNPFFGGYVHAHMKNSDVNAVYLGVGSLGLGRSYYQREDTKNTQTLGQYSDFVSSLYSRIDQRTKDLKGPKIVAFEKDIASYLKTIEEARDAQKRYNPVAVKDLREMVRNIDIANYIETLGFNTDTVIISEINYYRNLDKIIAQENLPTIKEYLKFNLMNDAAGYLSTSLDTLSFDFYGRQLKGQKEQRAIEKRGLDFVNSAAGELLGKLYVEEHFPPEAKLACEELVQYLIQSFEMRIQDLDWMSDETKEKALEKLSKFTVKIGYPDKWKDYSKLAVSSSLFENVQALNRWAFEDNLSKQGKPVDKGEWGMTPQTVNAYYNPLFNEIVFPAAILQAPFYDYRADAAVNFGGIGAVIGHELSHGFDDSGSQYDGDGNLNNWWTEEDKGKFDAAADALVAQFEVYQPVPGVFVNGRFTLGENIGDLGGSSVAFDALQLYLKDQGSPGLIDGYTPEQRFFLSWATIWRTKTTEEFVVNQVKTDPHSPAQYRAFAPIINLDAFHEAFQTKPGDKMYKPKDKRIKIW